MELALVILVGPFLASVGNEAHSVAYRSRFPGNSSRGWRSSPRYRKAVWTRCWRNRSLFCLALTLGWLAFGTWTVLAESSNHSSLFVWACLAPIIISLAVEAFLRKRGKLANTLTTSGLAEPLYLSISVISLAALAYTLSQGVPQ
ncbi:MAG: hypothetical protein AAFN79_11610 [Pseudomonadota bacterium]